MTGSSKSGRSRFRNTPARGSGEIRGPAGLALPPRLPRRRGLHRRAGRARGRGQHARGGGPRGIGRSGAPKEFRTIGPGDPFRSVRHLLALAGRGAGDWTPQYRYLLPPRKMEDGGANLPEWRPRPPNSGLPDNARVKEGEFLPGGPSRTHARRWALAREIHPKRPEGSSVPVPVFSGICPMMPLQPGTSRQV